MFKIWMDLFWNQNQIHHQKVNLNHLGIPHVANSLILPMNGKKTELGLDIAVTFRLGALLMASQEELRPRAPDNRHHIQNFMQGLVILQHLQLSPSHRPIG